MKKFAKFLASVVIVLVWSFAQAKIVNYSISTVKTWVSNEKKAPEVYILSASE